MSGESKLRHVAAMNPPGRGSISTEEADQVLQRLAALEEVAEAARAWRDWLVGLPFVGPEHDLRAAISALDAVLAAETGSGEAPAEWTARVSETWLDEAQDPRR